MSGELSGGEKSLDRSVDASKFGGESLIGNRLAVELNTFVDTFQMRRSEEACRKSRGAQNRFQHRRRGPFAVCAGNMRRRNRAMRRAQIVRKDADIFEVEFLHEPVAGRRVLCRGIA